MSPQDSSFPAHTNPPAVSDSGSVPWPGRQLSGTVPWPAQAGSAAGHHSGSLLPGIPGNPAWLRRGPG